jgi:peptidoglycan/xylan/chitin deacetylase (PgdA/CDA1 family)
MSKWCRIILILFSTLLFILCTGVLLSSHQGSTGGDLPQRSSQPDNAEPVRQTQDSTLPAETAARPSAQNPPSQHAGATIAFTFDDGYLSDFLYAYPILKKYGIRGTSFIIGEYPDKQTPYALNWEQIRAMHEYGWCFGCHTYAHSRLTELTSAQIAGSMEKENAAFARQGLPLPTVHAFPYGSYDQQSVECLHPYRKILRKANYDEKILKPGDIDPDGVDSISADMITEKRLLTREKLVDKASADHGIIVFRIHGMYKEKRDDTGRWPVQTDSRLFEKLVKYCVDKGCRFITMDELAAFCRR